MSSKDLDEFSPSCLFIYYILENNGKMTQKDIIEESRLPARTVRYAMNKLIEENHVMKIPRPTDARQDYYYIDTLED